VTGINHDKSKKINPSLIYKEIPVTAYNERIKQENEQEITFFAIPTRAA